MSSPLTEVSTFSATVVGPDAGNPVTAASVRVMGTSLANRTTYLEGAKADLAGDTFTGPVTGDVGEFIWPVSPGDRPFSAQVNNGATVSASSSFVMRKAFSIAHVIPTGGAGYTAPTIWTTPSVPWILEGAVVHITASAAIDAPAGFVTMTLRLGSGLLMTCDLAPFAAGTVYAITGATANKTIFGLDAAEKGTLLTAPLTNSAVDSNGFGLDETSLSLVALDFRSAGILTKDVTIAITHGSGTPRTVTIPLEIVFWGRLI